MNYVFGFLLGFVAGCTYARGKEHPLCDAGKDLRRLAAWIGAKIRSGYIRWSQRHSA